MSDDEEKLWIDEEWWTKSALLADCCVKQKKTGRLIGFLPMYEIFETLDRQ